MRCLNERVTGEGEQMNAVDTEYCTNCTKRIGDLQTPYLLHNKVVCAECWRRLSGLTPEYRRPTHIPRAMNCPDCGGMVSRSAPRCPHCGRLMKQFDFFRMLILFLIVVAVLWLLSSIVP